VNRVRRRAEHERGNTLAEFAVVLTTAMVLIFGIIDFGRAMYVYHLVGNAARAGARYAIVRGSACTAPGCPADATSIRTYVRSLMPELNSAAVTVNTNWSNSSGCTTANNAPGCLVSVNVVYDLSMFAVPLLPNITMHMNSTSQMVISQ
jgi:Flp pilus assembly protein TadG